MRVYVKHQNPWSITRKNIRKIQYFYVLLWVIGEPQSALRRAERLFTIWICSYFPAGIPMCQRPKVQTNVWKEETFTLERAVSGGFPSTSLLKVQARGEFGAADETALGSKWWDSRCYNFDLFRNFLRTGCAGACSSESGSPQSHFSTLRLTGNLPY